MLKFRLIIPAFALLLTTTACTSNLSVQAPVESTITTKSAASDCPTIRARGGSAFYKGSGLAELDSSKTTHCYERNGTMRCWVEEAGWVTIPNQTHAPLLLELNVCSRWSLQRVGSSIWLFKHDAVRFTNWHPSNPTRVFLSLEGRSTPIVIPVEGCHQAREIQYRFGRTLDELPSCGDDIALLSVLGLPMGVE